LTCTRATNFLISRCRNLSSESRNRRDRTICSQSGKLLFNMKRCFEYPLSWSEFRPRHCTNLFLCGWLYADCTCRCIRKLIACDDALLLRRRKRDSIIVSRLGWYNMTIIYITNIKGIIIVTIFEYRVTELSILDCVLKNINK